MIMTCSEMVLIANTSVADDGPIPPEFTIPVRPSLRPNPMVPPACDSLMGTATIVGGSHAYTMQRDQPLMETAPTGIEGDTEPAPPGADGSNTVEYDPAAAQAAGYDYYSYVTDAKEGEIDWDYDETAPGVTKKPRERTERPPTESMPGSFISSSENCIVIIMIIEMDDYRRGNVPVDADGRQLAHYLDLSTLDSHTGKKKTHKIPHGFKTWKEYGEFKKKEKRARQVHDILEDKYPVEYLEKRRHK